MQDIPEESDIPAPIAPNEGEKSGYTIDLAFAVISSIFAFAWSVSGFPPNIILACICFAIAIGAMLDMVRRFCNDSGRFCRTKYIVFFGVPVLVVALSWSPVASQYKIQHEAKVHLLSGEAIQRIKSKLAACIPVSVCIAATDQNQEQFDIRKQLTAIFQQCGFTNVTMGLFLILKEEPLGVPITILTQKPTIPLNDALTQICEEMGQEPDIVKGSKNSIADITILIGITSKNWISTQRFISETLPKNSNTNSDHIFHGESDFQMFNKTLTPEQIEELYKQGPPTNN